MSNWRDDPAYSAIRRKSKNECLCCTDGKHMPTLPEEKKWQRYILPGIIAVTMATAIAMEYYFETRHSSENKRRDMSPSIIQKLR